MNNEHCKIYLEVTFQKIQEEKDLQTATSDITKTIHTSSFLLGSPEVFIRLTYSLDTIPTT